ncbi:MAG TPA: hypothetical protein VHY91_21000 [Pirellulales bacterium]|nr:hypothetical protein [Pirellulales bacterium]
MKKGWQHSEPGFVWRDRAITFEMMLDAAVQMKRMTWEDAERVTGIRAEELRQRIAMVYEEASSPEKGERQSIALSVPSLSLFTRTDEGVAEA